jgi:tripartite-type tricarboxylate transporter receptor subunit TctC
MPTLAEQGVTSYGFDLWNGLWTVAGTPQAAIAKLHAATLFALAQPDVQARFARIGIGAVGSPQAEFAVFVVARRDRAARLIRDANMTLG